MHCRAPNARFYAIAARSALVCLVCATSALGETHEPQLVVLDWEAGPGTESCMSAEELKEAVEAQLERGIFSFPGEETERMARVRVRLERTPEGTGFRARASFHSSGGSPAADSVKDESQRELHSSGEDCRTLDQQLALVVAVMAGSEVAAANEPPAEQRAEAKPFAASDAVIEKDSNEPIETVRGGGGAPAGPWVFELEAAAGAAIGVLPDPSVAGEIGGMMRPPRLPAFRLRAVGYAPDSVTVAPGASVTFTLAYAGLALCPALYASARLGLDACFGPGVGFLRASSSGFAGNRETTEVVVLMDTAVRGSLEITEGLHGIGTVAGIFPFNPDRFVYEVPGEGSRSIHRMDRASLAVTLGLALVIR